MCSFWPTLSVIKVSLQALTILESLETNFREISANLFFKTRYWKSWRTELIAWFYLVFYFVFQIWYFVFLAFCLYPPWPVLPWPHEYQEIMEILCHQIEIGRKCAKHFHFIPFLALKDKLHNLNLLHSWRLCNYCYIALKLRFYRLLENVFVFRFMVKNFEIEREWLEDEGGGHGATDIPFVLVGLP